ncbi:cupin domain-containing protein [Hymenobacter sp. ASUV-10]|uniref:Cupin domain-containing protein n=1 Tax=Hymenobacter aranciens TaxID=3063996 RepID=A0ABT9B8B6_9BACT|nr:cupin domain-containing protein [Hymenobacter sp. ASUV-10]MDO7874521.1 cupin domain-containing protein [Hymenobacter sp. ASUV-10]
MRYFSNVFIQDDDISWEAVGPGVRRKILAYDDSIMLVKADFETGGVGPIHQHFHSQTTYIESGEFAVTIGHETKVLRTGDAYYIPPHVPHGATALQAGVLLDMFSPIREDFMTGHPAYAEQSTATA